MAQLERTTITIPRQLYQKAKVQAAYEDKSLSGYISTVLAEKLESPVRKQVDLPIGKYQLGIRKLQRQDIYEDYLTSKVSH